MSETKRNKERVDRAWNKLYDRLDADGLLLSGRQDRKRLSASMLWKWGAVAAIWVGICVFLTVTYRKVGESVEAQALIMQENTEQSTLVTTLEDGSIVYMGGETSLQYPEHFSMDKREVSLQGNALFDVFTPFMKSDDSSLEYHSLWQNKDVFPTEYQDNENTCRQSCH